MFWVSHDRHMIMFLIIKDIFSCELASTMPYHILHDKHKIKFYCFYPKSKDVDNSYNQLYYSI